MRASVLLRLVALAALGLCGFAAPHPAAPRPSPSHPAWRPPRTPDGQPDLQGQWTNATLTPLERPAGIAALVVEDGEVAAVEARIDAERRRSPLGQFETEWHETPGLFRMDGKARTSVIVDPADGRLPYSEAGRRRLNTLRSRPLDGPEAATPGDRCLTPGWSAAGPPMLSAAYAPNYKIVQTRDSVVILAEMNSALRVIRLGAAHDGSAHDWMGDSVGRWEGDTLVIETTGFAPQEGLRAPVYLISPQARITERLTRVSPTEMRYAFTVDDPQVYTRSWRGEVAWRTLAAPIYEFACHEGNYAMAGMLAGARHDDRLAAQPKPSPEGKPGGY